MKKIWKRLAALTLTAGLVLGSRTYTWAYEYSGNEKLYLQGVEETAKSEKNSYYLTDIDGDQAMELLLAEEKTKGDALSVYLFDEAEKTTKKVLDVKKVVAAYRDQDGKKLILECKGKPQNSFREFTVEEGQVKKGDFYSSSKKKGGTYYCNKKRIKKKVYKDYVAGIKANAEELVFFKNNVWVDSDVIGAAQAAGETSLRDDFHLASNYEYLTKEHIQSDYEMDYFQTELSDKLETDLEAMFTDEEAYPSEKSEGLKICRDYYAFATDWDKRDQYGVEPLKPIVEGIEAAGTIDSLSALLTDPLKSPFSNLISFRVSNTEKHNLTWQGCIRPDSFSFDLELYINSPDSAAMVMEEDRKEFTERVLYLLDRLGYSREKGEEILENCYSLENEIVKALPPYSEERENELDETILDFPELTAQYKRFPLKELLQGFGAYREGSGDIKSFCPEYLAKLDELYTAENLDRFRDYLIAHTVYNAAGFLDLDSAARAAGLTYEGEAEPASREELIEDLNSVYETESRDTGTGGQKLRDNAIFSVAVENAYLDFFVNEEDKKAITAMMEEFRDTFRTMLMEEEWMSRAGREAAVEKLDAMVFQVLSPNEPIDPGYLAVPEDGSFFDGMVRFNASKAAHIASFAGQAVDRNRWSFDLEPLFGPTFVNCSHEASINQVRIYPAFIGDRTFSLSMPKEEQLGRIGTIIGHEITHGFDPNGSRYDKNGTLVGTDEAPWGWFPKEDYDNYRERVDKLEAFYDAQPVLPDIRMVGNTKSGEAAADMGGMAICLKLAEKDPDFDYEAYFRAWADLWRKQGSFSTISGQVAGDPHPPTFLRTNITVQQFDEFYETFGVKEGDKMYLAPEDRVKIW